MIAETSRLVSAKPSALREKVRAGGPAGFMIVRDIVPFEERANHAKFPKAGLLLGPGWLSVASAADPARSLDEVKKKAEASGEGITGH